MAAKAAIVFTGYGMISAVSSAGNTLTPDIDGAAPIKRFDAIGLKATHAGEVRGFKPLDYVSPIQARTIDRGTLLAISAVKEALEQANLGIAYDDVGIVVGVAGGNQFQNFQVTADKSFHINKRNALYYSRNTPLFQAEMLSRYFGLGGPRLAFACASVGGLLALGHARDLLIAGHADAMVVGGGEINSLINMLGMDSLGVTCEGAASPFDLSHGMCFGEGAAFFVMERRETAVARGAKILGELGPVSVTSDARTNFGYDPSGFGVTNAIQSAISRYNTSPDIIGWIRSCSTGHKSMDYAEANGIKMVFNENTPPVCNTEKLFGHVNGVSPLLGVAAILWAFENNRPPSRLVSDSLDKKKSLVALNNISLPKGDCLLSAMAFGGINAAAVIRKENNQTITSCTNSSITEKHQIIIDGLGMVSSLGVGVRAFLTRVENGFLQCDKAQEKRINDEWLTDTCFSKKDDRIIRMIVLAITEALKDAGMEGGNLCRTGLLLGLSRPPVKAGEIFSRDILLNDINRNFGRRMLKASSVSLANNISARFGLKDYVSVMSTGINGGVQLLSHGAELLVADETIDNLIVVAVDEWTERLDAIYRYLCKGKSTSEILHLFGDVGLGEGAGAIILKRVACSARNKISIKATSFAGKSKKFATSEKIYEKTITKALKRADLCGDDIGFVYGQQCDHYGNYPSEKKISSLLCPTAKYINVLSCTGLVESAGGLFSAISATAMLRGREKSKSIYTPRNSLLVGSNERGAYAALVISET